MRRGFWRVPGGIVDPGETPQAAAARALFEEAGITPTGPLWLVTETLNLRYFEERKPMRNQAVILPGKLANLS